MYKASSFLLKSSMKAPVLKPGLLMQPTTSSLSVCRIQTQSLSIVKRWYGVLNHTQESAAAAKPPTMDKDQKFWENPIPHPLYTKEEVNHIEKWHHTPKKLHERLAYYAVQLCRKGFDIASNYKGPGGKMQPHEWVRRCIFLETVAGVPGMVGGLSRHLRSLRTMRRDNGWIHTLLEEAENERMHLLIFMQMKDTNLFMRALVLGAQAVFFNAFFLTYLVHPKACHRFVGYLEEEAVKTYSGMLKDIEDGYLESWKKEKAPKIAQDYYCLGEEGTIEDMIKCVRADEANHRDVNHTLAALNQQTDINPFINKYKKKQLANATTTV